LQAQACSTPNESGQALVAYTLALGSILAMLGLTVDVGWAYFRKQAAQSAAESAAMSAASAARRLSSTFTCNTDLECPSSPSACPTSPISSALSPAYNALQIGCYYASQNGFSVVNGGAQNVTMTAGTGYPPTAPNVNTNYWVTARVSESIPQLFSRIIPGHNSLTAGARATAGLINISLSGCAYLLDTRGVDTLMVGTSSFVATGCSVNVDSSSPNAVDLKGTANMNVAQLNVVGGVVNQGSGGFGSTQIVTGVAPFSDPLASVQPPSPGTCMASVHATNTVNLTPGTYCGGITGAGGSTINFAPGVYILSGGGMSLNGNASGTGVMFYNTFDSNGQNFSPISVNGSGTINLTAPSSGPYQSMLFFEDRNAPAGTINAIEGSTGLNLVGNLYFPTSELDLGGSGSSTDVAIVANTLQLKGTGQFTETTLPTPSAPSAPQVTLIE
jgi:hypothetical protein